MTTKCPEQQPSPWFFLAGGGEDLWPGGRWRIGSLLGALQTLAFSIWKLSKTSENAGALQKVNKICLPILSQHHPMVVWHGGTSMVLVVRLGKGGHTCMK